MMRAILMLLPLTLLAGCGYQENGDRSSEAKPAEEVTVNADSTTGKASVKVPGVGSVDVNVPNMGDMGGDFDLDGVKLYPGAKVSAFAFGSGSSSDGKNASVKLSFSAPDAPAKVAAYYRTSLAEKNITVTGDDSSLHGKTGDGAPFTITLAATDNGQTTGQIALAPDSKE